MKKELCIEILNLKILFSLMEFAKLLILDGQLETIRKFCNSHVGHLVTFLLKWKWVKSIHLKQTVGLLVFLLMNSLMANSMSYIFQGEVYKDKV